MKPIFLELTNNQQILQAAYHYHISSEADRSSFPQSESIVFREFITYLKSEGQNPIVEYQLEGNRLLIPFFHPLPIYIRDNPLYCLDFPRVARIVAEKYADLSVIDIGANVGDTLTLLRTSTSAPVLCIEGDTDYFEVLQKNAASFEAVYLKKALLGEHNETLQGILTTERGTGFIETPDPSTAASNQTLQIQRLPDILAEFPQFQNAKLLKTDTDGFDYKILKGASEWLDRAKPILFFEYSPYLLSQQSDEARALFPDLSAKGYTDLLFYDQLGFLLLSVAIENLELLEDIYRYLMAKKTKNYCNVFAFHREDRDLFRAVKDSEIRFIETYS